MRFSPFHRNRPRPEDRQEAVPVPPRSWHESGVAAEVEAFLEGRLVDHLAALGQTVPTWAAVNRLAHADHEELVRLVTGQGLDRIGHPSRRLHPWAETERFLAAHLLATKAATPEALTGIQRDALVPVELSLIELSKTERFRPEQVLDAASAALDNHRTA